MKSEPNETEPPIPDEDLRITWPRDRFRPGESLWIIFLKIGLFNFQPTKALYSAFRRPEGAIGRNNHGFGSGNLQSAKAIDFRKMAAVSGVRQSYFRHCGVDQFWDYPDHMAPYWTWNHLRYCEACLNAGYHSVLFQFRGLDNCPFHGIKISSTCPSCGKTIPYVLPRRASSAFVCRSCGNQIAVIDRSIHEVEIDTERFLKAAREVIHVCKTWKMTPHHVFRWNQSESYAGTAEADTPFHARNLFRYVLDCFDPGPDSTLCKIIEPSRLHAVLRRTDPNRVRIKRAVAKKYYRKLGRLYWKVTKRLMRRLRVRGSVHRRFMTEEENLKPNEWLYLVVRGYWENNALANLNWKSDMNDDRLDYFRGMGEAVHSRASAYRLRLFRVDALRFLPNSLVWANMNAWLSLYYALLDGASELSRLGRHPGEIVRYLRNSSIGDLPLVVYLGPKNGGKTHELHFWSTPPDQQVRASEFDLT